MSFYAVRSGRVPGIYQTWNECETQVKGFSNARYKKFSTKNEALEFLNSESDLKSASNKNNLVCQTDTVTSKSKSKIGTTEKLEFATGITASKEIIKNQPNKKLRKLDFKDEKEYDTEDDDDDDEVIHRQLKQTLDPKVSFSFNNEIFSVYTDGACSQNGKKAATAGVGVFWGVSHPLNISRKLIGKQTNNRAEITAAIIAIRQAIDHNAKELNLYTDSQFMINCMTKWIYKWKSNDWKTGNGEPVKNIPDLKYLDAICSKIKVNWKYVTAHKGIFENEEADRLARLGLQQK